MKRALIYTRQSVAREESISLEVQEAACRSYAKQRGYRVLEVISDPGISGLQFDKRPGIRRALDLVEGHEVEVVLVYRWTRLSRKRYDQAVILDRIEKAGAHVESATEPVDATTAGGKLQRGVFLQFAAFESDLRSEQWKEAQARRREQGLPSGGGARFGYRYDRDAQRFEPDPDTAPHLRQAYLDYIAGAGLQTLVQRVNDKGVRSVRGNTFSVPTLSRALDSGFGAGLIITGKGKAAEFLPGAHEPVITPEEWEQYRRARAARSKVHPKLRTAKWHLAGLVRCSTCQGPMLVNSYHARKSQVICSNYKNRGRNHCSGTWINRVELEKRVAVWLGGHVDALARHGWDSQQRDDERTRLQAEVSALAARRAEIEQALGRLATGWATGVLDDAGYRHARSDLDAQREALDADLARLHARLDALAPADADVYERLAQATEGMETGEWNALIKRVIESVTVSKGAIVIQPVVGTPAALERS